MDWRRLELWITLALYIAAGVALAVTLAKRLLPAGSPAQRVAAAVAEYLSELGSIGSGGLIVIILILVGGTVTMALLTKGVDLFREMTGRNDQLREEGREEGRKEGREEGKKEGREEGLEMGREQGREESQAEIRNRLRELGVDLDELLRSGADGDGAKNGEGRRWRRGTRRRLNR